MDSLETQRHALESLREVRPGMLIDHIEESASDSGPAKGRALVMRLRSHVEARTFDELRVFELGRIVRLNDPEWHEVIVQLVYDARGILVDTTGLVADPASEGGGRPGRGGRKTPGASPAPSKPAQPPGRPGPTTAAPRPPPITTNMSPSWSTGADRSPTIEIPAAPSPPPLGRPAPSHMVHAPQRPAPNTAPGAARPTHRFFALCEGRLFCPICAQALTVQSMGHERRSYYTCASRHLHPATESQPEIFFPVEAVDSVVWERIADKLPNLDVALELVRDAVAKGAAGSEGRKSQIRSRLERLERDELEVLSLRSEDRISEGAAHRRLDELRKERRSLEDELEGDSGAVSKLRPLSKAIADLADFCKRTGQPCAEADYGLRRRMVEACVPLSAEYGILPHADGSLEIRDLLAELKLAPTFAHRARSLGRMVGALKDQVAGARPQSDTDAPAGPGRITRLLASFRAPEAKDEAQSQDLGKALRSVMFEPQTLQIREAAPHRPPWLLYGSLLIASVLVAIAFQPVRQDAEGYENQAEQLGLTAQLEVLHQVPGGWIGVTQPAWEGSKDRQVALSLCDALLARLDPAPRDTITLMVPGGLPVAECGKTLARPRVQ